MFKLGPARIARKRVAASMISVALLCGAAFSPMPGATEEVEPDGSVIWPILGPAGGTPPKGSVPIQVPVPMLASNEFGWLADTEFLPPSAGPGPVTFDKAHPYVRNNTTGQPTFRIGDVRNPILQPWVVRRMKKDNDEVLAGKFAFTARSSCWPAGVPGFMVFGCGGRTVYFIQTLKEVTIINEGDQQARHVYMNVPHSVRPKSSWYGESIGHYEAGDILVIDTIGLNDKTFIDNYRTPHTTQLHVVERWKLTGGGQTLEVDIRIEDPGAFTTAWSARQVYTRARQGAMTEQVCAENNTNYFGQNVSPIPTAKIPDF